MNNEQAINVVVLNTLAEIRDLLREQTENQRSMLKLATRNMELIEANEKRGEEARALLERAYGTMDGSADH